MIIFNIKYVVLLILVLKLIVALCFNSRVIIDKFNIQQEYYRLVDIGRVKEIKEMDIPVSYPVYDPKDEIEVNSY